MAKKNDNNNENDKDIKASACKACGSLKHREWYWIEGWGYTCPDSPPPTEEELKKGGILF